MGLVSPFLAFMVMLSVGLSRKRTELRRSERPQAGKKPNFSQATLRPDQYFGYFTTFFRSFQPWSLNLEIGCRKDTKQSQMPPRCKAQRFPWSLACTFSPESQTHRPSQPLPRLPLYPCIICLLEDGPTPSISFLQLHTHIKFQNSKNCL